MLCFMKLAETTFAHARAVLRNTCSVCASLVFLSTTGTCAESNQAASQVVPHLPNNLQQRWFFVWRDLNDPKEVDRMMARFPRAKAAGFNGVAFSHNIPRAKAVELKQAAQENGLDVVAIVMGGIRDRNYVEGLPVKDALFVVSGRKATFSPDNPTHVLNGDYEDFSDNHFKKWGFQDDEGVTSFADPEIKHGGKASLRMENFGKNQYRHCRISQPIKLQPFRHYRISVWVKSENLSPADPEIKILTANAQQGISF